MQSRRSDETWGLVETPPASALDFSLRADPALLPELMDEPCAYEVFRDNLRDLASVNRWTMAYRPTLRFLKQAWRSHEGTQRPLRVVDVGSGGGDGLRRVALLAARMRTRVELTGIDLNPYATRAAREFTGTDPRFAGIRWITGDVFTEPAVQNCDLVISSLMTHHMQDGEIVRFLSWMEARASVGWFVNDLLRSARSYRFFRIFARWMRWHSFVQHDGPVSIRRGFRSEDWRRLIAAAGLEGEHLRLMQPVPGRLCVERCRR